MRTSLLAFCLLILISSSLAQVQLTYYLPSDVTYNPAIPTPQSFFGFQVGEWHLSPDHIHAYMKALDQASERITMEPMGQSYEQRQIWLMTVTSPENHKNLSAIKQQHVALSDPTQSSSINIDNLPVVVWMGYSVHGNEPSGANASVLVAYYLAAAQGPAIDQLFKETVILLNPSINPDGLNRFAHWANTHKGKFLVGDSNSREHNEAWPGGRTNHYWFDLNRDWMPAQLPETQARIAKYYEWMPNVLTDHHEMGTNSTFFFQPGIPTRNHPLTPKRIIELTEAIAQYHVKDLDKIGSLYYSKEGYDDYYIGKGSSFTDITGTVGILFEQASSRGHLQESSNGPLSFPFTIRNQITTSLSTLKAAQALRKELLSHQREFFSSAWKEAEKSGIKAYVFGTSSDPSRNYHFVEILRRHRIEVHELAKQVRSDGKIFEPGNAYIVSTSQKQYRFLTALFERRKEFEDSLFYDVSSWTLPLAFNIPFAELKAAPHDLFGKEIDAPVPPSGKIVGGTSNYAYALEWKTYYAPRALYRFLKAGVRTKVATKQFEATTADGKHAFDYGTIVIPLGSQQDKLDVIKRIVETATQQDGVTVFALASGYSAGGVDLGSPSFETVQLPKVALVVGAGVSSTDVGGAWHLLDQRFEMETTLLEIPVLNRADLSRYNVIAMASGNYSGVDSAGTTNLRRWVENGGTLITMESASEWAVNARLATAKFRRDEPSRRDTIVARRAYGDESKHTGAMNVDGAICEVRYDRTHPLLFGYQDSTLSVFRSNNLFMDPSRNPYATPVIYTANPLVSGYLNKQYDKHIKNSAGVVVSGLRSGRVILMTDNPNFRAFWYGTNKLFLNGIFFGSTIRASSARADE